MLTKNELPVAIDRIIPVSRRAAETLAEYTSRDNTYHVYIDLFGRFGLTADRLRDLIDENIDCFIADITRTNMPEAPGHEAFLVTIELTGE